MSFRVKEALQLLRPIAGHHLAGSSSYNAGGSAGNSSPLSYQNGCAGNRHPHQQAHPVVAEIGSNGGCNADLIMNRDSAPTVGSMSSSPSAGATDLVPTSFAPGAGSSHYYHSSWNEAKI